MIGEVIAHFILPFEYNTEEAIRAWMACNHKGYRVPYVVTWETVGTIGDRDLIKGDGHNHVYIVSTSNITLVTRHDPAGGEYVA